MEKTKRRALTATAGALALVGITAAGGTARASGSTEALPVSACAVSIGTPYFGWDGLYNDATSGTMTLDCGLPMTTYVNSIDHVSVWVDDEASGSVSCRMRMMGSGITLATGALKSTTSNGRQALSWNYFDWGTAGPVSGTPFVSCTVPAKSTARSGVLGLFAHQQP